MVILFIQALMTSNQELGEALKSQLLVAQYAVIHQYHQLELCLIV